MITHPLYSVLFYHSTYAINVLQFLAYQNLTFDNDDELDETFVTPSL